MLSCIIVFIQLVSVYPLHYVYECSTQTAQTMTMMPSTKACIINLLYNEPSIISERVHNKNNIFYPLKECLDRKCKLSRSNEKGSDNRSNFIINTSDNFHNNFPNCSETYNVGFYGSGQCFAECIYLTRLCETYNYENLQLIFIDPMYEDASVCEALGTTLSRWIKTINPTCNYHFLFYSNLASYTNDQPLYPINSFISIDALNHVANEFKEIKNSLSDNGIWNFIGVCKIHGKIKLTTVSGYKKELETLDEKIQKQYMQ